MKDTQFSGGEFESQQKCVSRITIQIVGKLYEYLFSFFVSDGQTDTHTHTHTQRNRNLTDTDRRKSRKKTNISDQKTSTNKRNCLKTQQQKSSPIVSFVMD
jgi:hypothetical protein